MTELGPAENPGPIRQLVGQVDRKVGVQHVGDDFREGVRLQIMHQRLGWPYIDFDPVDARILGEMIIRAADLAGSSAPLAVDPIQQMIAYLNEPTASAEVSPARVVTADGRVTINGPHVNITPGQARAFAHQIMRAALAAEGRES